MSRIFDSVTELIGNTPLLELKKIEKQFGLKNRLLAKLESLNPAGSIKDRVALEMINDAENRGIINRNTVIIEPTSGNTGIGLAAIAASKGYRVMIVMPDTMSEERRLLVKAYGAELILTDGKLGMQGAIDKAEELSREIDDSFIVGQFVNPANPNAHFKTTGPEIWRDTDGKLDIFVAGVGTGGTITGVGKYLKQKDPNIHIIAVEPDSSPVLSEGRSGAHKLQGIGAGFVPQILDTKVYDEIIRVRDENAYEMCRLIGKTEGILVGISSGAALCAAVTAAKRTENFGKNIVVILPDTGDRYLSTGMFY